MEQVLGCFWEGIDARNRFATCPYHVRVGRFIKTNVTVAYLNKIQFGRRNLDPSVADSPKTVDVRTPPLIDQTIPVPAHAMHFKNPRRSILSSSLFFAM